MNARTRIALIALVFSLLMGALTPAALAGDQFNLLVNNNNFDTPGEDLGSGYLPPWTITNKSSDRSDCNETLAAFSGKCAFRFKGSATEASRLVQIVKNSDLDTLNAFVDDANVSIQMAYYINSLSTFTNLKAKTVVTLAGSDEKIKSVANFSGSTMIGEFTNWQSVDGTVAIVPQDSVVTKVKVVFANKSSKGKALIDDVAVLFASM